MERPMAIAIDGPAAAGKSTVAKLVAKQLGYIYIDTGAMYRALTLKALNAKISLHDQHQLAQLLLKTSIELQQSNQEQRVFLDGQDVTLDIRSQEVTNHVSLVSQYAKIREQMVKRQQTLAKNKGVVMDGRDIGTYVLPDAEVKFFLIASVEERAKRRHEENIQKGFSSNLSDIISHIKQRDSLDSERKVAPLTKAKDAFEIDTTSLSIHDVVSVILTRIESE